MGKLLTFGEVMGRLEPSEAQMRFQQVLPGNLRCTFAGAEANVAASYTLLGGEAKYVTALPEGPLTSAFLTQMIGIGVDTSSIVITKKGRMGLFFLEAGAVQRPSKVWYDRKWSSISMLTPEEYDWEDIFKGVSYLHISGITPALSKEAADTSIYIVKEAKARGIRVSIDLNFRKKLWDWQVGKSAKELASEIVSQMVSYADLVIGNEEDFSDILGIKAGNTDVTKGKLDIEQYPTVAAKVCEKYPNVKFVACTLRESISANHNNWGAMLYSAEEGKASFGPVDAKDVYTPYRITDIVDRVGGGDSFAAALLFALQDEELKDSASKCVAFAAAASCLCHTIKGDFNYNSKEEVMSLMNGNASGRVSR